MVHLRPDNSAIDWGRVVAPIREMVERIAEITGADPSLLTFDSSKDRGDAEIVDWAVRLPPGWKIKNDANTGLRKLVSLI